LEEFFFRKRKLASFWPILPKSGECSIISVNSPIEKWCASWRSRHLLSFLVDRVPRGRSHDFIATAERKLRSSLFASTDLNLSSRFLLRPSPGGQNGTLRLLGIPCVPRPRHEDGAQGRPASDLRHCQGQAPLLPALEAFQAHVDPGQYSRYCARLLVPLLESAPGR